MDRWCFIDDQRQSTKARVPRNHFQSRASEQVVYTSLHMYTRRALRRHLAREQAIAMAASDWWQWCHGAAQCTCPNLGAHSYSSTRVLAAGVVHRVRLSNFNSWSKPPAPGSALRACEAACDSFSPQSMQHCSWYQLWPQVTVPWQCHKCQWHWHRTRSVPL